MNVCCYWHLWFCGVTQLFYKQGGHWSEQAQQAVTSCWNMGTGRRENGGTEKKCGEQVEGERRRVKEESALGEICQSQFRLRGGQIFLLPSLDDYSVTGSALANLTSASDVASLGF